MSCSVFSLDVIKIVSRLLAMDFYSAFIICDRFSCFSVNCSNVELRFCNVSLFLLLGSFFTAKIIFILTSLIIRLRIFMQLFIFINTTKEVKSKRFTLFPKYWKRYFRTLYALCVFLYLQIFTNTKSTDHPILLKNDKTYVCDGTL